MLYAVIVEYFINLFRTFFTKIYNWKGLDAINWIAVINILLFIAVMPFVFDLISIYFTTQIKVVIAIIWLIAFFFSVEIMNYFAMNPKIYIHEHDQSGKLIKIKV